MTTLKIEKEKVEVFEPVTLSFTVTTQDDLDRWGAMLYHGMVTDYLNLDGCGSAEMAQEANSSIRKYYKANLDTMFAQ